MGWRGRGCGSGASGVLSSDFQALQLWSPNSPTWKRKHADNFFSVFSRPFLYPASIYGSSDVPGVVLTKEQSRLRLATSLLTASLLPFLSPGSKLPGPPGLHQEGAAGGGRAGLLQGPVPQPAEGGPLHRLRVLLVRVLLQPLPPHEEGTQLASRAGRQPEVSHGGDLLKEDLTCDLELH